ncbi:MAG: MFS transporter [Gammaproteobacteria bacterium]|nr:MAG: MFS transporter [Gammaproteobacteria bacterium]
MTAVRAAALSPDEAGSSPSLAARWYVLVMMCLVYTLSIADRYVVSTVLDPIRVELGLTDSGVAWLTGAAFGLFYVVLGFPLSWLIDRKSRRNIVAACLVLWSVMTSVCGLAHTSLQFFLARVGVTVGEAGGTPGANSLLSDYFPAERRAMALTVFSLGAPFGAWVGYNVAGVIADHYGWRAVFYALGVPGVLAGIAVWLTVREPKRGCLDSEDDGDAPGILETMRFLWRQRSAVHVMIGSAVCALWGWGLMYWTPTFLQRTYHLTPGEAGHHRDRVADGTAHDGRFPTHRVAPGRWHRRCDAGVRGGLLHARPGARESDVLDLHTLHLLLYRSLLRFAQ